MTLCRDAQQNAVQHTEKSVNRLLDSALRPRKGARAFWYALLCFYFWAPLE